VPEESPWLIDLADQSGPGRVAVAVAGPTGQDGVLAEKAWKIEIDLDSNKASRRTAGSALLS
jgi:hypothetical protein